MNDTQNTVNYSYTHNHGISYVRKLHLHMGRAVTSVLDLNSAVTVFLLPHFDISFASYNQRTWRKSCQIPQQILPLEVLGSA